MAIKMGAAWDFPDVGSGAYARQPRVHLGKVAISSASFTVRRHNGYVGNWMISGCGKDRRKPALLFPSRPRAVKRIGEAHCKNLPSPACGRRAGDEGARHGKDPHPRPSPASGRGEPTGASLQSRSTMNRKSTSCPLLAGSTICGVAAILGLRAVKRCLPVNHGQDARSGEIFRAVEVVVTAKRASDPTGSLDARRVVAGPCVAACKRRGLDQWGSAIRATRQFAYRSWESLTSDPAPMEESSDASSSIKASG